MSQPAIIVEGISKRYRLGHQASPHQTFREMAMGMLAAPFRKLRSAHEGGAQGEEFWALKDVNFEVQPGEVVGIIGRNGAGKSTLLKILSRITEPTTGQIRMRGRVASLLEVGTGFHPELTGRENIYLNGAILGMKRAEITKKFDEIVAFAETEKFLDTPVKFYSSGMYVRLAFAVAAHLEPEILIVDEVLAVGDAEFQRKCIGKMREVSEGNGRTVLFVSHNMGAIVDLCTKCFRFENGYVRSQGMPTDVIAQHLRASDKSKGGGEFRLPIQSTKAFQLLSGRIINSEGQLVQRFSCDEPVTMEFDCESREPLPGLYGYLKISRVDGTCIMVSDSFDCGQNPLDRLPIGRHSMQISIPERTLAPGHYLVYINFASSQSVDGFDVDSPGEILSFRLDDYGTKRGNNRQGYFSTRLQWNTAVLANSGPT